MAITAVNTTNPIKVTGTTSTTDEVWAKGPPVFVKHIYWYNPSTAGHLLSLTDSNGNVIIKCIAEAANDSQQWAIYGSYNGIICNDMDSGELYIYI